MLWLLIQKYKKKNTTFNFAQGLLLCSNQLGVSTANTGIRNGRKEEEKKYNKITLKPFRAVLFKARLINAN